MSASWSTTATHWYFDLSFSTDFIAACLGFSSAGGRGNDTYRLHKIIRHESTNKYADRVLRVFLFEGHKRQVTIGPVNVTVGCPGRFRAGIESMSSCRLSATCVTRGLRMRSYKRSSDVPMKARLRATPSTSRTRRRPRRCTSNTFTTRTDAAMPADRHLPSRRSVRLSQQGPRHYAGDELDFPQSASPAELTLEYPDDNSLPALSPESDSGSSYSGEYCTYTPPTRSTSHSRRRGDNHIPRPPNAFMLFRSDFWAQQKESAVERDHRNVSRAAGVLWNALPEHEREQYRHKAQLKKKAHARMYPDYKYTPVFRKEKAPCKRRTKRGSLDEEEHSSPCRRQERRVKHEPRLMEDTLATPRPRAARHARAAPTHASAPASLSTPTAGSRQQTPVKQEPEQSEMQLKFLDGTFVPIDEIPPLSLSPEAESPAEEKCPELHTPPRSLARDEAHRDPTPYFAHEKFPAHPMWPEAPNDSLFPAVAVYTADHLYSPGTQYAGADTPFPAYTPETCASDQYTFGASSLGAPMDSGIDFESMYTTSSTDAGLYPRRVLYSESGMAFTDPFSELNKSHPSRAPETPVDPLTIAPNDAYYWLEQQLPPPPPYYY